MATHSMNYDNATYVSPYIVAFETASGAATVSAKFCAFTTMLLKSATVSPTTTGTLTAAANNTYTFSLVTNNGTTTTSCGFVDLAALGTSQTFQRGTNVLLTGTMTQGDFVVAKSGTDGTMKSSITYEFLIAPCANVTL